MAECEHDWVPGDDGMAFCMNCHETASPRIPNPTQIRLAALEGALRQAEEAMQVTLHPFRPDLVPGTCGCDKCQALDCALEAVRRSLGEGSVTADTRTARGPEYPPTAATPGETEGKGAPSACDHPAVGMSVPGLKCLRCGALGYWDNGAWLPAASQEPGEGPCK